MKKYLSILFAAVLLMTACFALAEEDAPKLTAVRLTDLDIVFGLPSDMEPKENNATITDDGEPFFGFISQDGQLSVDFYGSNLSDLSEAEAWATKNIGAEITKYDVTVNGMNAIEYHYVVTDKEGNTAFADVLFIENENDKIIEFWEKTFDEERTGKLSSEIYPISLFDDYVADNQNQEASAEQTEAAPASDTATESYSGTCTADKVNLREEAKANARSIGQINRGEKLVVLESEGEWTKVRCSKGEGYIKTQYIEMK